MFQFNYVDLGAGLPPAPIVTMNIYPPEWERSSTGDICYSCAAFLDTGSDCTLLPLEAISALNLTTFKANAAIIGVGGGQMQGKIASNSFGLSCFDIFSYFVSS